jgi:hypothetical protein
LRTIYNPHHHDGKDSAVEAPNRIKCCAVSNPGKEDRDKDQRSKQLHSPITYSDKWQNNKAPVNKFPNRLSINEIMEYTLKIRDVIHQSTVAEYGRLESWRIKQ